MEHTWIGSCCKHARSICLDPSISRNFTLRQALSLGPCDRIYDPALPEHVVEHWLPQWFLRQCWWNRCDLPSWKTMKSKRNSRNPWRHIGLNAISTKLWTWNFKQIWALGCLRMERAFPHILVLKRKRYHSQNKLPVNLWWNRIVDGC